MDQYHKLMCFKCRALRYCLPILIAMQLITRAQDDPVKDKPSSAERSLDLGILKQLVSESSLILVGEVVAQPISDSSTGGARQFNAKYPASLHERTPFKVRIHEVISGNPLTNAVINVSVIRDEVNFRYSTGERFIFFLKKANVSASTSDEWRAVADYFGILPWQLALEHMIRELRKASVTPEKARKQE